MTIAQRSRADAMIEAKGQIVTIATRAAQAYDPATGTVTATPGSVTAHAVLLPLSPAKRMGNAAIAAGDETLLIGALDTDGTAFAEPPVAAVVTLADGSKRTIVAIETLRPAGLAIMFDAVVRRVG